MKVNHKKKYNNPKLKDDEAPNVVSRLFLPILQSQNILLSLPKRLSCFKGGKKNPTTQKPQTSVSVCGAVFGSHVTESYGMLYTM